MNPWTDTIPNTCKDGEQSCSAATEMCAEARFFGMDSALRRIKHQLDGAAHQSKLRTDLRMFALAGFIPERGYKKIQAFSDAVELMKELARNTR